MKSWRRSRQPMSDRSAIRTLRTSRGMRSLPVLPSGVECVTVTEAGQRCVLSGDGPGCAAADRRLRGRATGRATVAYAVLRMCPAECPLKLGTCDTHLPMQSLAAPSGQAIANMLSSELVRSVLDSAPDAMIVIDSAGTILFANRQVTALFGYRTGAGRRRRRGAAARALSRAAHGAPRPATRATCACGPWAWDWSCSAGARTAASSRSKSA